MDGGDGGLMERWVRRAAPVVEAAAERVEKAWEVEAEWRSIVGRGLGVGEG